MRIVYNSFAGRFSDSPRAIYQALGSDHDHLWLCDAAHAESFPPDIETVELGGAESIAALSALSRLDACFRATALDELFPPEARFSAEDSLPAPTSKPDPAIYVFAHERVGIRAEDGLAIEDSVSGARAAVAAGFRTLGNVMFVPADERAERARALEGVGVEAAIASWRELAYSPCTTFPAAPSSRIR